MNFWSAEATRTVSEVVPASVAAVRDFYVDLDNIAAVHPLVVAVHATGGDDDADGYWKTYRVADRIRLAGAPLRIRYHVRMTVPRRGDVIAESRQFPAVALHTTVSFDEVAGGGASVTRLTERMRIRAPRPLLAVTVRKAVAAHTTMLTGIRNHFS